MAAAASVDQITLKYALAQLSVADTQAQDPDFRSKLRELLFSAVERRMASERSLTDGAAESASAEENAATADAAAENSDSSLSSDDSSDSSSSSSSESEGEDAADGGRESGSGSASLSKRKKAAGGSSIFAREMVLSAPLAAFFGTPRLPRGEAAKRLWAYVRESSLPKNPRGQYVCDDKLSAALGGRKTLDFKTAAKALAAGMKDPRDLVGGGKDSDSDRHDDESSTARAAGAGAGAGGPAKRRRASAAHETTTTTSSGGGGGGALKAPAKRPRLTAGGDDDDDHHDGAGDSSESDSDSESGTESQAEKASGKGSSKPEGKGKGKGGFAREVPVSEAMAAFLGSETGSRSGAVKAIWLHVKAAGLQKPQDKRVIILDDKLKPLFPAGTKTVTMFSMVRRCRLMRAGLQTRQDGASATVTSTRRFPLLELIQLPCRTSTCPSTSSRRHGDELDELLAMLHRILIMIMIIAAALRWRSYECHADSPAVGLSMDVVLPRPVP